jgi:eukaryotic-like serine/threonine-protein kinase
MVQVYVPEGEFLMGAADSDGGASVERPQHTVYLDAYWIYRTEVTNGLYQKCVTAGTCKVPYSTKSYTRNSYYGNPVYDNYPVIYVDWGHANTYCGWAGGRLPSEAEWEKAARGTDGRLYPWGNQGPDNTLLNINGVDDTSVVGKYLKGASIYGAWDMAGNVWEWVKDWFSETYYQNSPDSNPTGPSSGTARVLRGGSWDYYPFYIRASARGRNTLDRLSYYSIGFRCVR